MQKGHSVLLVDVGSASVGACIAEAEKGGRLIISHVVRTPLKNTSGENTSAIAALAADALKTTLDGLKAVSPSPREAHIVLAAPWYTAEIKTVRSESQRMLRITEGTVQKALRDYDEKHPKNLPGGKIESAVSQAYVNGYPTALAKPLQGTTLKIDLYESRGDASFLKNLTEIVRTAFAGIHTEFHSFPFAAFAALRGVRDEQSFVCADVGGEITDIAVINRGALSFAGSFPVGSLTLLRAIAGKGSVADASSRMTLFAKRELSQEEQSAFAPVFEKAAAAWNAGYEGLLGQAVLETPIPNTTFLIADKEELQWFAEVLAFAKGSFSVHPVLINPAFFEGSILLGEGGVYDAFLSIAALYILRIKK